ncbi:hypothetical protein FRX31_024382 [Thalictrum thalictroides]|uniref:Uncharacterized protein n=1 Tax=Thalictrum thalictroides TaxID=46969 RepID=A0A7J6VM76_THATH|nr:hypothetical protein FRX31_024382 [Thalictrum thalictroides]
MAQATVLLFFVILAAIASTFHAQVNQCEYVIMIHTGSTKGPTVKLKPLIEAVGGGNINTTNLVKNWGDMGKGHTYFLPNSSDRFKYNGPCFNGRFCYFQLRGKKGELNPHWYVHNITVTTKGEGIDRVRVFFSGGVEIDYLYSPPLNDGECP